MGKDKELTELEKAKKLIQEDKEARAKRFKELIEQASAETRCKLQVVLSLQGATIVSEIKGVVLD